MKLTIYIGADHGGYKLKHELKRFLAQRGYHVVDVGAHALNPTDDYPLYAYKAAKAVAQKKAKGILICKSAEGICIAANKVKGIRAVPVWTLKNAKLSREHNDANILCLAGIELSAPKAKAIVKTWLETSFSGAARHVRRIKEITRIEHGKKPR